MDIKKIGNFIKKERTNRGLSREDLAQKLGISPSNIKKIENGKKLISLKSITVLSKVFDVTVAEILSGKRNIMQSEENKIIISTLKYIKRKNATIITILIVLLIISFLI